MLRMQSIPAEDFGYNARGMDISHNFPTVHYIRSRMGEEPASENETKALIRIIQEYDGRGLLTFAQSGREIIYYHCQQGVGSLPKSYRLARHMQKSSSYHLEREQMTESAREKFKGMGTPEQYYIQTKKQPAFRIKVPAQSGNGRGVESKHLLLVFDLFLGVYETQRGLPCASEMIIFQQQLFPVFRISCGYLS